MHSESDAAWTRRAFIAAVTTTAIAGCSPKPNTARVVPRKTSPNARLNIASIGPGKKGLEDVMSCNSENIIALCDVDWDYRHPARAAKSFPRARRFNDYRTMLDTMPEIDAVLVSTPDHHHAPAAYRAMMLGKHVYVQKPLTHTVAEARLLLETARTTGVVTQMGNQGASGHDTRTLCEMIGGGAIGGVHRLDVWTDMPDWPQGLAERPPTEPVPPGLDWDLWLGPAPERAFSPRYLHESWRAWWDFGTGALGDMACHLLDAPWRALRLADALQVTVEVLEETATNSETMPLASVLKFSFPERGGLPALELFWYDGTARPPYPRGLRAGEWVGGEGSEGALYHGDSGFITTGEYSTYPRLLPQSRMETYVLPAQTLPRVRNQNHYANWLDACKGTGTPCSSFEHAAPLSYLPLLGNIALRMRTPLEWDMQQLRILNSPEANLYLSKPYRAGWEIPA